MKLVMFEAQGQKSPGLMSEDGQQIMPLAALGFEVPDLMAFIRLGDAALAELSGKAVFTDAAISTADVTLLAPIPNPEQDVICLGINYMAHAAESARYKKEAFGGERPYAVYFSKRVNEAVAPYGQIDAHADMVDSLDYEAELAVIIGKEARHVAEKDVKDYIFGYTVLNDVSARNIQTRHKQWYFGKSLDGFTPMGPCIATRDSFAWPPVLGIRSYVNGELRQNSDTGLLIFGIDHVVSELSRGMTLRPGTIISMGTPAGVGMGFVPPRFLRSGDVVECVIDGIGSIRNTVIDER